MMAKNIVRRRLTIAIALAGVVAAIVLAVQPSPVLVETGRVQRGPLLVTIDQEGETRAHDRFVVSAPVPGLLMRVDLEDGDSIRRNEMVARIDPLPLSQREREELVARVGVAEAALRQANARKAHAREDRELARRNRERAEGLGRAGVISVEELEQARNSDVTAEEELNAAAYAVDVSASELKVAQAGLVGLGSDPGGRAPLIELRSPVSGRVLRVLEKSERVVQAGTPIITVGEPGKLEVVADVLSTDAVRILPGAPVLLEGWGGDHPIRARVRLVEPAGFTKVSALGVEEKRVNVVSDFVDLPGPLGDSYRVQARIVVWSGDKVLQIPTSAIFRVGQAWNVFLVQGGRAIRREIEIGHRNETATEILGGLSEGDEVVLHPPNQLSEGLRVRTK
jgi:HlyD family secretion protein